MKKLIGLVLTLLVLAVSAPSAFAVGPAKLTVTDLTTSTVLTQTGTLSDPFLLTNGHQYEFKLFGGWAYELMRESITTSGDWTSVSYGWTETATGTPCAGTTLTDGYQVLCDSTIDEQGDQITMVKITATLQTANHTGRIRWNANSVAHPDIPNTVQYWDS